MTVLLNDILNLCIKSSGEPNPKLEKYAREHYDKESNTFFFKTKTGRKLTIAPSLLMHEADNIAVPVLDETETHYTLVNFDGLQIEFPKELAKVNDLKIIDGKLVLTEGIYTHWMEKKNRISDAIYQRFRNNIGKVLENKKLILQDARYFLIRIPGMFQTYGRHFTLGQWLEELDTFRCKVITDKQKHIVSGKAVAFSIVGSWMNDIHQCSAWDLENQKSVSGYSSAYGILRDYAFDGERKYSLKLQSNNLHALMLLNEIGA